MRRKPYCPEHLCDLIRVAYARIWKCPLNDYQVDDIIGVTQEDLLATLQSRNVRAALGIDIQTVFGPVKVVPNVYGKVGLDKTGHFKGGISTELEDD